VTHNLIGWFKSQSLLAQIPGSILVHENNPAVLLVKLTLSTPYPWCLNPHDVEITSPSLMLSKSSIYCFPPLPSQAAPPPFARLPRWCTAPHAPMPHGRAPAVPQHPWRCHGDRGWRRSNRRSRGEGNPHRQTSWACRGALELEDELKNWFPGNFWIVYYLMIYGWLLNDVWMMQRCFVNALQLWIIRKWFVDHLWTLWVHDL
jgi:hypothetical protein